MGSSGLWNRIAIEVPPGALESLLRGYGRGVAAHADLHALVPLAAALEAAVDLQHELVVADIDLGDLHQVAGARRRTALPRDLRPLLLVVAVLGVELQRLLGARQQHLDGGVLGGQAARQLHAVFPGQFVPRRQQPRRERQDGNDGETSHTSLSAGGSVSGENLPANRSLPEIDEQRDQHHGSQNTGFRAILPATPQTAGGPRHLVARHLHSKPADVHPEQGECEVPPEMQADRQPQIAAAQVRVAEQDAETRRVGRAEPGGAGVAAVQQARRRCPPE